MLIKSFLNNQGLMKSFLNNQGLIKSFLNNQAFVKYINSVLCVSRIPHFYYSSNCYAIPNNPKLARVAIVTLIITHTYSFTSRG